MKIGGRQRKERGILCSGASKLYVHIPFNPQYHKTLIKPTEMMETMKTETGLHSIICLIVPSLRNLQCLYCYRNYFVQIFLHLTISVMFPKVILPERETFYFNIELKFKLSKRFI